MMSIRHAWGTLIGTSLCCFTGFLDFAIVNTALPTIQVDLKTTLLTLQWVMSSFVLVHSVLLATMGHLGDLFGLKRMILIGVAIFGLASLFAGLANSVIMLIIMRAVQGGSLAIVFPCSVGLITHAFPDSLRAKAVGIWTAVGSVGLALGPSVGGIIVSTIGWRWIFFINVPIAILALIVGSYVMHSQSVEHTDEGIDWGGFFLLIFSVVCLVVAIIQGPNWGWLITLILLLASVVGFWILYLVEHKVKMPVIEFSLFINHTFLASLLASTTSLFFIWAAFFMIPLYLQNLLNFQAYEVGLIMLLVPLPMLFTAPLAGHWMDTSGPKHPIVFGLILLSLSALMQCFFTENTYIYYILIAMVLFGIGWGSIFGTGAAAGVGALPARLSGIASGVFWTIQNIGGAIGLALGGVIFRIASKYHGGLEYGFRWAMLLLLLVSVVTAVIVSIYLPPKKVDT